MSQAILLSIIIPTYNAQETLGACLNSLCPTLPQHSEVIVVNDGSTDGTSEILSDYEQRYPALQVITQQNKGRAGARNTGLNYAQGLFIGFVDADDTVQPDMFSKMLNRALATSADIVLCDYTAFNEDLSRALFTYQSGSSKDYGASFLAKPSMIRTFGASLCNKIVRKNLYGDDSANIGEPLRFPEDKEIEDLTVIYPLLTRATRVEMIDESLYNYRHHKSGSISRTYDEHFLEIIDALDLAFERIAPQLRKDPDIQRDLLYIALTHLYKGRFTDLFRFAPIPLSLHYLSASALWLDATFPGWQRSDELKALFPNSITRTCLIAPPLHLWLLGGTKLKQRLRSLRR